MGKEKYFDKTMFEHENSSDKRGDLMGFFDIVVEKVVKEGIKLVGTTIENIKEDIMREETSIIEVDKFTMDDLMGYCQRMSNQIEQIKGCQLVLEKKKTVGEKIYPENRFVVSIVFLDNTNSLVPIEGTEQSYYGRIIVARGITKKVLEFMDGENVKYLSLK